MDLSKYRQLFVSETQEMIETLGQTLVALERSPDSTESVNTAFRHFHSIKGMSGTMGFSAMFELAHQLEELMARVRDARLALGPAIVDLLLAGVDQLSAWIGEIEAGGAPARAEALHDRIRSLLGATKPPPPVDPAGNTALASRSGDLLILAELKEPVEVSIRGYLLVRRLGQLGSVIDTVPPLDRLRSGYGSAHIKVALRGASEDRVRAFLDALPDWQGVRIEIAEPEDPEESLEGLVFTGSFGTPPPPSAPPRPAAIVRPPQPARSVRVRTAWLDRMISRIEALRMSAVGVERPELHRLITALADEANTIRLVPLTMLTDRLPRVVRDLARHAGKKAELVIEGADEQVDRSIIEGMDVALTHLLRNAVAHGIETPAQRTAANKREAGRITLHVSTTREALVIELADDGAGVDTEGLADRASELGLLDAGQARWYAEHDPCRLLCLPGLTTRLVAGAGAGRGIGMDAVAEAVEALGGRIAMTTRPEHGTRFVVHLPRIRGVSGLLLVRIAGQVFALKRESIRHRLSGPAVERTGDRVWHGSKVWPIRQVPGVAPQYGGVVVLLDDPPTALEVDEIVGEHDLLVQPLPAPLDHLPAVAGAVRLPTGEPIVVLSIEGLIEHG